MPATYAKLKTGEWGVRVQGTQPAAGQTVTVTRKDGQTKSARVGSVIWSGDGVYPCSIEDSAPRRSGCDCDQECCRPRCHCDSQCNCKGGPIYDC